MLVASYVVSLITDGSPNTLWVLWDRDEALCAAQSFWNDSADLAPLDCWWPNRAATWSVIPRDGADFSKSAWDPSKDRTVMSVQRVDTWPPRNEPCDGHRPR